MSKENEDPRDNIGGIAEERKKVRRKKRREVIIPYGVTLIPILCCLPSTKNAPGRQAAITWHTSQRKTDEEK